MFILILVLPLGATSQLNNAKLILTNEEVIDLLSTGLAPEIITAKIKSSDCKFDTSPAALKRLKLAHVPDLVILAMVQAPPVKVEILKTARVVCAPNWTQVSLWFAPGRLTEVASLKCGAKVDILQDGELWVKVRNEDRKEGYVSRQSLSDRIQDIETSAGSKDGPAIKEQRTPPVALLPGRSSCDPAIEDTISGAFEGWSGETIFKLDNGKIWEQDEYDYDYDYDYRPDVTIYRTAAGCRMRVEGSNGAILVRRIR